jgi:hypothetical protein
MQVHIPIQQVYQHVHYVIKVIIHQRMHQYVYHVHLDYIRMVKDDRNVCHVHLVVWHLTSPVGQLNVLNVKQADMHQPQVSCDSFIFEIVT